MNEDQNIRAALDRHWAASDANDFEAEHEIYHNDAVLSTRSPGSASAVGTIFKRLVLRSRTRSVLWCGAYSVLPTFGSLN
jgi:hypothetical protein